MQLQRLELKNFRGFAERSITFHPNFNVLIGTNGTGKTSVLEGAAVALGAWLQGFPGSDTRNIRIRDVRRIEQESGERFRLLSQYPVEVFAQAVMSLPQIDQSSSNPVDVTWMRSLDSQGGRTTQTGSHQLRKYARAAAQAILEGTTITLPVIRYFGAGRLWESVRQSEKRKRIVNLKHISEVEDDQDISTAEKMSDPFYGYKMSLDKRASPTDLVRWIGEERRNEIDLERPSTALNLVYKAILSMLPELSAVRYELRRKSLLVEQNGLVTGFEDMSDGYRNIIAMTADIAIKMTMLNPHLRGNALTETPGVVLIDELDLHLHPTWQRRVAEDLRRTFPCVQFICTSHSPFIVQSLRSGSELIVLDGQPTAETANMTIEEVAEGLMRVENAEVGGRYLAMKDTARKLLEAMEKSDLSSREKFDEFQRRLAAEVSPYADNPAYQAFLEMKLAKHFPSDTK